MIRRNNLNFNLISLQQLFNYFLILKIFIQYCNVKTFITTDNILSYELNNRINLKIKQCANLHSFNQIISSNHHRFHCFWRKHVYIIYVNLLKKCRHSCKMQYFFFSVELFTLTNVIINDISFIIFIQIASLIFVCHASINVFSIFILVFVMQLLQNFLLIFDLIDDSFKKYILVHTLKQLFITNQKLQRLILEFSKNFSIHFIESDQNNQISRDSLWLLEIIFF